MFTARTTEGSGRPKKQKYLPKGSLNFHAFSKRIFDLFERTLSLTFSFGTPVRNPTKNEQFGKKFTSPPNQQPILLDGMNNRSDDIN
jgi:hypothetical protein